MPKYGTFRYGRIAKYGRYNLVGSSKVIGPYIQYRMRNMGHDHVSTAYVRMVQERIDIPAEALISQFRVRANEGEWVYTQDTEVVGETFKVRIRSLESNGDLSPWVYGEKGNLKSI